MRGNKVHDAVEIAGGSVQTQTHTAKPTPTHTHTHTHTQIIAWILLERGGSERRKHAPVVWASCDQ